MQVRAVFAAVAAVMLLFAALPPTVPSRVAAQNAGGLPLAHTAAGADDSRPTPLCGTHLLLERDRELLSTVPYRLLNEIDPSEFTTLDLPGDREFGRLDVLGQTTQFWADNLVTGAKYQVTATLKRVTDNGYIYVDNARPVSDSALDKIASEWEHIYTATTTLFGNPPDVDGDARITILLLDILDGFDGRGGYVAGYFSSANQKAVRGSNLRELLYVDTNPGIPEDRGTLFTIAHEFQHMINWNYHQAAGGQDTWLNEGLAEFAGFNAGYGHTPNIHSFLRDTNDDLLDWSYQTRDYGSAYLFTLYLWEKYGGDALLRAILQNPGLSVDAVDAALAQMGSPDRFRQVFDKWVVANYLGDTQSAGGVYGYRTLKLVDNLAPGDPTNNVTTFRRPPLTNSFASYPVNTAGTVHHWAARYYRFTGSGDALNLGFTGKSGVTFAAAVVSSTTDTFAAGSNTVRAMPLNDASGALAVAALGSATRSVLLVPSIQQSAPSGAFTVSYSLTGAIGGLPAATPTPAASATPTGGSLAPQLVGPLNGAQLGTLGTQLTWLLPAGTTQYQLQVTPFNGDGPAINLIRNAEPSFTIPAPQLGRGDYIMLPGMTYTWRVRATSKPTFAPESDPSWGPWTSRVFRTPAPGSAGIQAVAPAHAATLAGAGPVALTWSHPDASLYYFEVQVSGDIRFDPNPATASSFVWWNLVHGGVTVPLNSWATPPLQPNTTYYWRVRPRVQGDGTPVAWSPTFWFRTSAAGAAPAATPTAAGAATPTATPTPAASPTASPTGTAVAVPTATPVAGPSPTVPPPTAAEQALEADVVARMNDMRSQAGLAPLTVDPKLTAAARRHSNDMASGDFLGHTGSDGSTFAERVNAAGYAWETLGEIISGQPDARSAMNEWMGSTAQRNILQGSAYRHAGAGVVRAASGKLYWTVVLAAPR